MPVLGKVVKGVFVPEQHIQTAWGLTTGTLLDVTVPAGKIIKITHLTSGTSTTTTSGITLTVDGNDVVVGGLIRSANTGDGNTWQINSQIGTSTNPQRSVWTGIQFTDVYVSQSFQFKKPSGNSEQTCYVGYVIGRME